MQKKWSSVVPWFLTIITTVMLAVIGYFLISNINWFTEGVFAEGVLYANDGKFRFIAYNLHLSMIKRSVGLFTGFTMMLLGFGVAFYTIQEKTELSGGNGTLNASLATASPGIVAMIVGSVLMMYTIGSKDNFQIKDVTPQSQTEVKHLPLPKYDDNTTH